VNPLLIHKSKKQCTGLMAENLPGWLVGTSPNAYITDDIWRSWVKDFIKKARTPRNKGKTLFLYMDGFGAHKDLDMLAELRRNNIEVGIGRRNPINTHT
jgi:hypothetical protein